MLRIVALFRTSLAVFRSPVSGYWVWLILFEPVGGPRGGDVVGDVGALLGLLVGAHNERLHEGREDDPHDDQRNDPAADAVQRPAPAPPPECVGDEQGAQCPADDHHDAHAGQAGVNVGVACTRDHAARREQQIPGLEDVARTGQREDDPEQHRQMGDRLAARSDDEAHVGLAGAAPERAAATEGAACRRLRLLGGSDRPLLGQHEAPERAVNDHRGDQTGDERSHDETVDRLPGGQREDVEADVVVEDRVGGVERHAVQGTLEQQPVGRRAGAHDDRDHERDDEAAAAQPLHRAFVDVLDDVDALEGTVARRQAPRDLDVGVEDGEEDGAGRYPDDEPRPDLAPEDDPQADLAEPEPVGVGQQVDDEQHESEHEGRDDDRGDQAAPAGLRRARLLGRHLVDLGHGAIIADAAVLNACRADGGPRRPHHPAGARRSLSCATNGYRAPTCGQKAPPHDLG